MDLPQQPHPQPVEYNSPYREHQGHDSYNTCRANRHRSSLPDSFGRRHRIHSASDDLESGADLAATHFTAQPGTTSHQNISLTSRQVTAESALAQSCSKLSARAALPNSNNDEVAQHEWSSNPIENTMARGVRETHQSILFQRSPPCVCVNLTSGGERSLATTAYQGRLALVFLPLGAAVNKIKSATLTLPSARGRPRAHLHPTFPRNNC